MMTVMVSEAHDTARQAMVASQLRTSAVNDPRVVAAMAAVPREAFVGEADVAMAYRDRPLPLGGGRFQNAPLATGRLLTQAAVQPQDRVLLIAAARGYTAAVLARLARQVVAVEGDAGLVAAARVGLAGLDNVDLVEGPLTRGAAGAEPFDVMVIDGAIEHLPDMLLDQVRPGGRVVSGVIDKGVARLASGIRSGGFALVPFADIDCVALPGFERPRGFQFPG